MTTASPDRYVTTAKMPDGSGYHGALWRRSDNSLVYMTPQPCATRAIARRVAQQDGQRPRTPQVPQ